MNRKVKHILIALISGWLLLFGGFPLLLLLVNSFLAHRPDTLFSPSLSIDSYKELATASYFDILVRTIKLSGLTTAACLLLAYPFAWITARVERRHRLVILILVMIPFWTNSLIRTYALRMIIGAQGLLNKALLAAGLIEAPLRLMYSDTAVVLGLIYLMFPFMVLPLYANMEKFDQRLVEAARDLGAGPLASFWKVVLPLTLPGIVAGCTMVFVPAMGLFYVAALLGGAKNLLVGNLIHYHFLVSRNWPLGSAMSVALLLMMALMFILHYLVTRNFSSAGRRP